MDGSPCRAKDVEKLAEVSPVRGDDEQHSGDRKRDRRNNRPLTRKTEQGDLCGDEPDAGEVEQQEPDPAPSATEAANDWAA
jgi:hypothetical protein